jgi:FkbM family methyltransferase
MRTHLNLAGLGFLLLVFVGPFLAANRHPVVVRGGPLKLSKYRSSQGWLQCLNSWDTLLTQVPSLSRANNLYSVDKGELDANLDAPTRGTLSLVAQVGGYSDVSSDTLLLYVGGNEHCTVGKQMRAMYKLDSMLVFEPVPSFFKQLQSAFSGPDGVGVQLYNFGLGDQNLNITVPLAGAGTSTVRSHDACAMGMCEVVEIREAIGVIGPILSANSNREAMLYTNCEGCEVLVLERLLDTGLITRFKHVHVATHARGTPHYVSRICHIRERLNETHTMVFGLPYAQERYVRND